jgi:hypothetical protein
MSETQNVNSYYVIYFDLLFHREILWTGVSAAPGGWHITTIKGVQNRKRDQKNEAIERA